MEIKRRNFREKSKKMEEKKTELWREIPGFSN